MSNSEDIGKKYLQGGLTESHYPCLEKESYKIPQGTSSCTVAGNRKKLREVLKTKDLHDM